MGWYFHFEHCFECTFCGLTREEFFGVGRQWKFAVGVAVFDILLYVMAYVF